MQSVESTVITGARVAKKLFLCSLLLPLSVMVLNVFSHDKNDRYSDSVAGLKTMIH